MQNFQRVCIVDLPRICLATGWCIYPLLFDKMIRCYRTRVVTDQRARPSGSMQLGIGLEPASTLFGLRETKNCRRICGRRRAAYRPTQSSLNNGRTHTPRTVSDPAPEHSALPSRHLRAACAIMAAVTLVGCCTETRRM